MGRGYASSQLGFRAADWWKYTKNSSRLQRASKLDRTMRNSWYIKKKKTSEEKGLQWWLGWVRRVQECQQSWYRIKEEPQPTLVRQIAASQPSSHLMRSCSGGQGRYRAGKAPVFLVWTIAALRINLLLHCYCTVAFSHLARGKQKYII